MIASFLMVGTQPHAEGMVRSVKATQGCKVVQMSDLTTPKVAGVDEVVRLPFKIPLMLYRMRHLAQYQHEEMMILDTDVIAKRPVDIWSQDFDVALTYRGHDVIDGADEIACPINTGVMFSRSNDFWAECYCWLVSQPENLHRWYGDQRAVAHVASNGTYKVLPLTCDEYNWSPNSRDDTSEARLWHYKGAIRKKWIV